MLEEGCVWFVVDWEDVQLALVNSDLMFLLVVLEIFLYVEIDKL